MKSRVILSLNLTRAASAAAIIAGAICRAGPPDSAAEVARRLQRFRYAVQMHVKKNTNLGLIINQILENQVGKILLNP